MHEARHILDSHVVVRWIRILSNDIRAGNFLPSLTTHDQNRARRYQRDADRDRFIMGRVLLRHLVNSQFETMPAELPIQLTENQRPYLAGFPETAFSISHAEEVVIVALTRRGQVGIDVEFTPRRVDLTGVAERIFSAKDLAHFMSLPEAEKMEAFFRAWTGKEAILKAQGLGISGGLSDVSVPFLPTWVPHAPALTLADQANGNWRLQSLPVPAGYVGTIAWDQPDKKMDVAEVDFESGLMTAADITSR